MEIGASELAPLAVATPTAIFAVMVSFSKLEVESLDVPKYCTNEPAEYCAVPSEKSMFSIAQPEPQSRPLGPDVV
jgi:hypothetical protein